MQASFDQAVYVSVVLQSCTNIMNLCGLVDYREIHIQGKTCRHSLSYPPLLQLKFKCALPQIEGNRFYHISLTPPPLNTHNTDIAIKECAAYAGIAVHSGTEEDDYQNPNSKFPKIL